MKELTKSVKYWLAAFAGVSLLALVLVVIGINSRPVVSVNQTQVRAAGAEMLEYVRAGDYDALSGCLVGNPMLGVAPEKDESATSRIWYAYLDSITYELSDSCYGMESGVGLDAVVHCLDVEAITDAMEKIAPALLENKAGSAQKESDIYDANHQYLESVVAEVMAQAAQEALQGELPEKELSLTLQLERVDGQWCVVPTQAVLALLSGSLGQ